MNRGRGNRGGAVRGGRGRGGAVRGGGAPRGGAIRGGGVGRGRGGGPSDAPSERYPFLILLPPSPPSLYWLLLFRFTCYNLFNTDLLLTI